ncbi:hypothetical protein ACGC1H_001877 [Rhizoctonia solani]
MRPPACSYQKRDPSPHSLGSQTTCQSDSPCSCAFLMDDQFVTFLRSVSESRISPSGTVPRSYASHDGFLVEVKAIRSEYITMRFTAPDGRAVIALIPRELWGADDSASNLVAEDVRRCVIRVIRASKDRQMGVRVTSSRSATAPGDDYGDGHGSSYASRRRLHGVPSLSLGSDSTDQSWEESLRTPSRLVDNFAGAIYT